MVSREGGKEICERVAMRLPLFSVSYFATCAHNQEYGLERLLWGLYKLKNNRQGDLGTETQESNHEKVWDQKETIPTTPLSPYLNIKEEIKQYKEDTQIRYPK